jgi:hypothetical protein
MMHRLKIISGVLALCFWFASFFVWKYFDAHLPTTANPGDGRIYPLSAHGSVVYLTSGEHYFLYGLIVAGTTLFLLTVAIHFFGDR